MRKETYRTRTGVTQYRPVVPASRLFSYDTTGFCLACGHTQGGVEPDARKYTCGACGAPMNSALPLCDTRP